ncbi:MAG: hypothetical protein R2736_04525 [Solirubrobacterales bacterium]
MDDRVDQRGLAQATEAVDAQLASDRVQVGERALLESGAVEHGHGMVSLGGGRLAIRARWTAPGDWA